MNIAASDLIGTWILQSAVFRFEDDGESVEFYGARPTGVATFTKEGRLIAILSSGDRPATGDDASKARLFDAAMAYSGNSKSAARHSSPLSMSPRFPNGWARGNCATCNSTARS